MCGECRKFLKEVKYLHSQGLDTKLIKYHQKHILYPMNTLKKIYKNIQKTWNNLKGIAPCYEINMEELDVVFRYDSLREFLWDENLYGKILCEGAQGFWLDKIWETIICNIK